MSNNTRQKQLKKLLVLSSLLLLNTLVFSQRAFRGFFATSYIIADANSDKERRVKGNISVVYNDSYCLFSVDGRPSSFFATRDYSKKLVGEYIHTDFISRETGIAPDGRYGIMIDEGKSGKMFQVVMENITFLADKSIAFTEDGKVPGNAYIKNWKDMEQKAKHADSSNISKAQQNEDYIKELSRIADSTAGAR